MTNITQMTTTINNLPAQVNASLLGSFINAALGVLIVPTLFILWKMFYTWLVNRDTKSDLIKRLLLLGELNPLNTTLSMILPENMKFAFETYDGKTEVFCKQLLTSKKFERENPKLYNALYEADAEAANQKPPGKINGNKKLPELFTMNLSDFYEIGKIRKFIGTSFNTFGGGTSVTFSLFSLPPKNHTNNKSQPAEENQQ